ncbi:hypothetical protein C9374_000279 [Naegleria lovaniensis]|uniref:Adenylate and Guanylate cyclase catalytic domain containing protein n=1 Tax=Naegleria lovaniensis TaxID=51637 RepID=A0AA88KMD2_NAELO|nr:uncharacterized protein C9374_000279 [Naegleria lovaniensis]KAG2388840.1 hypothetical protein C9374_000279 [Naegleria lovaniensis]
MLSLDSLHNPQLQQQQPIAERSETHISYHGSLTSSDHTVHTSSASSFNSPLKIVTGKVRNIYLELKTNEVMYYGLQKALYTFIFLYYVYLNLIIPITCSFSSYTNSLFTTNKNSSPFGVYGDFVMRILSYGVTFSLDAINSLEAFVALCCVATAMNALYLISLIIQFKSTKGNFQHKIQILNSFLGIVIVLIAPVSIFLMTTFVDANPSELLYSEKYGIQSTLTRLPLMTYLGEQTLPFFVLSFFSMLFVLFCLFVASMLLPLNNPKNGLWFINSDNLVISVQFVSIASEVMIKFLIPPTYLYVRAALQLISSVIQLGIFLMYLPFFRRCENSLFVFGLSGRVASSIGMLISSAIFNSSASSMSTDLGLGLMALTLALCLLGGVVGGVGCEIYTRLVCRQVRRKLSIVETQHENTNVESSNVYTLEGESIRSLNLFLRFSIFHSQDYLNVACSFVKSAFHQRLLKDCSLLLSASCVISCECAENNNYVMANALLKKAVNLCDNAWMLTRIQECLLDIELELSSTSALGRNGVELKSVIMKLEKKQEDLLTTHKTFWKEFLSDVPDIKKIAMINRKANQLTQFCDKMYRHLMSNFRHNKRVLRLFASYVEQFKFDKEYANFLYEEANQLEEEESKSKHFQKYPKNKVLPMISVKATSVSSIGTIPIAINNEKEVAAAEESFEGIENQQVDKKQVFFRTTLSIPYRSTLKNISFISAAAISVAIFVVSLALCLSLGRVESEIPLALESCLPGVVPSSLIREVRMKQIMIELFVNQNRSIPQNNLTTEGIHFLAYQQNYIHRFHNYRNYLEKLITNSVSNKYSTKIYTDYTIPENLLNIPVATEGTTIEYTNSFKQNNSLSEITQELIHFTDLFLKWNDEDFNKTTTSYPFMYLYLNRRTAADAYAVFCSKFQTARTMNQQIENTLKLYLFISNGIFILLYGGLIVVARIDMYNINKILHLYKRIPKDIIGGIYQELQKKNSQDFKQLGRGISSKNKIIIYASLVILIVTLCIGLMYYDMYMVITTTSETMWQIDIATSIMRSAVRISVRLSEFFAFNGIQSGKFINNPAVGSASQLATFRSDVKQYSLDIQNMYNALFYGSSQSSPLIGKYPRIDEIILGVYKCENKSTCMTLQAVLSKFTVYSVKWGDDLWNLNFAKRSEVFFQYLELFNFTDEVFKRMLELLEHLVSYTQSVTRALTACCFTVGIVTLILLSYLIFGEFRKHDEEITTLRFFLNFVPIDHLENDENLKNFVLHHALSSHTRAKQSNSEDSITNLLSSMVEGAVLANEKGEITLFNEAAQKMFGKALSDVLGLPLYSLFDPNKEEFLKKVCHQFKNQVDAMDKKHGDIFELECIRKNQTTFPGMVNLFVTKTGAGTKIISCFVKDITMEKKQNSLLAEEKKNSDMLLRNILPESVANRLKAGETFIAEKFNDITCLFSDMVGFTTMSSQMNPTELVTMLNSIVNGYDVLTDRYQLEKIKTIGDAYFCVGGIGNTQSDHPERTLKFAINIFDVVRSCNDENRQKYGHQINIRVGINTGSAVAGVIGKKKFAYDLWGDTINISSRMESTSLPGKIQISRSTYERVYDLGFEFEERMVEVKGKGTCKTYLLKSHHHVSALIDENVFVTRIEQPAAIVALSTTMHSPNELMTSTPVEEIITASEQDIVK